MALTPSEILQVISRVKRDMPRNAIVMELCEAAERLVAASQVKTEKPRLTRAQIQRNYRLRKKAAKK